MNPETLHELAEKYVEVRELLKDNQSLSVMLIKAQVDSWRAAMLDRLAEFDRAHTAADAKLADRLTEAERKLEMQSAYNARLRDRIKVLEAHNATTAQGGAQEQARAEQAKAEASSG